MTEFIVLRGFVSGGVSYARGDPYTVDAADKSAAVPMLRRHGLIGTPEEAAERRAKHGGGPCEVPPIRGI